jgi:hypothetical protein
MHELIRDPVKLIAISSPAWSWNLALRELSRAYRTSKFKGRGKRHPR